MQKIEIFQLDALRVARQDTCIDADEEEAVQIEWALNQEGRY